MRVSKYRENPLITPFSMLCPGISHSSKHNHLTFFNGQVLGKKSYLELCNNNVLNIIACGGTLDMDVGDSWLIEENGGVSNDASKIPSDREILQSFAWLTNITTMTFIDNDQTTPYQLFVGSFVCVAIHQRQCVPPSSYKPWYIWTKEGYKIKMK